MTTPTQTEPLQLSVSNFGPIAKAEVDLRPLTVFVGPSNTGKSYLAILIYVLHRFFNRYVNVRDFGFELMPPSLSRSVREQQPVDADSVRRLVDWVRDVLVQVESPSSPVQLPNFIMPMVRPLFAISSNLTGVIAEEIERSFGIEDTARLIRHGNREGAKITWQFNPFAYELILKRGKPAAAVISISEETPLYIDPHTELMKHVLFWAQKVLRTRVSGDDDWREDVEYLIAELSNLILSNTVSPLHNAAHYLPADRTRHDARTPRSHCLLDSTCAAYGSPA